MHRGLIVLLGLVLAGGLAVALIHWAGGKDQALAELLRDPMASRSHPGASLITEDDITASRRGVIFNKPRSTQVLRSFAPRDQSAARLYQQLAASAEASGWRLQPSPNGSQGTKRFSFGTATISIGINTLVSPAQVAVVLEPA